MSNNETTINNFKEKGLEGFIDITIDFTTFKDYNKRIKNIKNLMKDKNVYVHVKINTSSQ